MSCGVPSFHADWCGRFLIARSRPCSHAANVGGHASRSARDRPGEPRAVIVTRSNSTTRSDHIPRGSARIDAVASLLSLSFRWWSPYKDGERNNLEAIALLSPPCLRYSADFQMRSGRHFANVPDGFMFGHPGKTMLLIANKFCP
jgi:hypothetical protein